MSILAWIVLGLIAGFIGSKLVNRTGEGVLLDIVTLNDVLNTGFSKSDLL